MKRKKFLALLMAGVITAGCIPAYTIARAGPNEEEAVDDPYSGNLAGLIRDRQEIEREREDADRLYSQNMDKAEKSIKDMEQVNSHLQEEQQKYPDYEKVSENKHSVEDNIETAKGLLMENTGASSTGEYKYGIEIAPDAWQQQEANDRFSQITSLADETADDDMTVDEYRGFYDLSKTRKKIVKKALSEKGRISYQWGGKSLSKDEPAALDCSGFVRWIYHYATGKDYNTMISTASVGKNYEQIDRADLKPGDVGMKNEEGTCYVSASGDKFSTAGAAKNSNRSHNKKIKDDIKDLKEDLKSDIKEIRDNEKTDIKEIKAQKDKPAGTKKTDKAPDDNDVTKTKVSDSTDTYTLSQKDDSVKKKKVSETSDTYTLDDGAVEANADIGDQSLSRPEKIKKVKDAADKAVKSLKKNVSSEISSLKKDLVDEEDVHMQTGHIGIYAGKDKDGNDTWVHCTGGSKDTVVVTTEDEYDGFVYYYSPLEGTKSESHSRKIRKDSGVPEADYEVEVPYDLDYWGTKTYERYTAIRAKSSAQYKLQQYASTDPSGFRQVNGRYMIAVGTGVTSDIGRYVDLVLENGTVIPCIVGDIKSDAHTEKKYRLMTRASHCVSEFIVDGDLIKGSIGRGGDISAYTTYWDSPVKKFIVYKNRISVN